MNRAQAEKLLAVDDYWEKGSLFMSMATGAFPILSEWHHTHVHMAITNWAQRVKNNQLIINGKKHTFNFIDL